MKNDFYKKWGGRMIWLTIPMIGVFFVICSCSAVSGPITEKSEPDKTSVDSGKQVNVAHLKIKSKGMEKQDNKKPVLWIKFIQYSIDGKLLEAHNVMKDYERTIDLAPGKHILHVERLQRGILSARALILDEGDCYEFTLLKEQTGIFEGMALPGLKWDAKGFAGVQSWKKNEGSSLCTN